MGPASGSEKFGEVELTALSDVIDSGLLWRGNGASWGGPQGVGGVAVDRFEDAFADWLGVRLVHAVNSGTSANEAAIASLGLEPGDEVICPAASPIFVPLSVVALGCIPVFADVDPETLLIDPDRIGQVMSERTRAVVVVHLWGRPAPMTKILEIAGAYGLQVVEDCAQSLGTTLDGQRLGTFGDAACFSLQQSKHVSSGEGGLVGTRTPEAYARAVLHSNSGIPSFRHGVTASGAGLAPADSGILGFGHNHRMTELQGAVALAQFSRLDALLERRAALSAVVENRLGRSDGSKVRGATPTPRAHVSWWKYPVLVPPGRGTYVGIPVREPVFREMSVRRTTPLGTPIPDYVDYRPDSFPCAWAGAEQVRVVSVHHARLENDVLRDLDRMLAVL